MPHPITDETRVTVRLEGETLNVTTLGLFEKDNWLSDLEIRWMRQDLARHGSYAGGGGAQPNWSVEVAS